MLRFGSGSVMLFASLYKDAVIVCDDAFLVRRTCPISDAKNPTSVVWVIFHGWHARSGQKVFDDNHVERVFCAWRQFGNAPTCFKGAKLQEDVEHQDRIVQLIFCLM